MITISNTNQTRLKDLMPENYGQILRERCGLKSRQRVYDVVNGEIKGNKIYSEAIKLAAETKAARDAEEKLLKKLGGA
ncbi:hypothetical protein EFB08_06580 [Rufibacter latericius]|uniref:Uncharacterized protein n=1 Tax=Rufibacter latericius TaxID=2487040 RepID=A0A3M9MU89_9BACT|nr:hypothetical protein EFB08_06580 [Rufibacter latericius]